MSTWATHWSRTVTTRTPSLHGRRRSSSIRPPKGSRRRSMTSRIASAGSRVARRPLSSLLLVMQVALLAARYGELTDMRTLADVSLRKGSDRQRLRGVLLIRSPSSVRFEALSPFGPPLMVVTVHEGQVTSYDALKNEARVGPADSETISKVLGLPLEADDLVSVLA